MADLRLSVHQGHVQVRTANLVTLVSIPDDETLTEEERAFCAFDAVLERAHILNQAGELAAIALYNPVTGQVAVGHVPFTEVFSDDRPLSLPLEGAPARLIGGELHVGGRILPQVSPSVASVIAAVSASDPLLVR